MVGEGVCLNWFEKDEDRPADEGCAGGSGRGS